MFYILFTLLHFFSHIVYKYKPKREVHMKSKNLLLAMIITITLLIYYKPVLVNQYQSIEKTDHLSESSLEVSLANLALLDIEKDDEVLLPLGLISQSDKAVCVKKITLKMQGKYDTRAFLKVLGKVIETPKRFPRVVNRVNDSLVLQTISNPVRIWVGELKNFAFVEAINVYVYKEPKRADLIRFTLESANDVVAVVCNSGKRVEVTGTFPIIHQVLY